MKSFRMLEKVNKMSFQNLGEFYNIIHRIGSVNLQQQESFNMSPFFRNPIIKSIKNKCITLRSYIFR